MRELQERKIPCAHLSSSQTASDYRLVSANLRKSPCPYRLLYVTPERFQVEEFMNILIDLRDRGELVMVAVDEAHCISTYEYIVNTSLYGIDGVMISAQPIGNSLLCEMLFLKHPLWLSLQQPPK